MPLGISSGLSMGKQDAAMCPQHPKLSRVMAPCSSHSLLKTLEKLLGSGDVCKGGQGEL